jgi:anaerobic selenocysteine-containing dehydrogenase
VDVRGDDDHPHSQGYTCSKGRSLGAFHHDAARLSRPRVDGVEVSWDRCLDDLAARIEAVRSSHGDKALAVYSSMGAASTAVGFSPIAGCSPSSVPAATAR